MAEDWRAAAFYLERSDPERWGRRTAHEITGGGDEPIAVRQEHALNLSKLSDDELDTLDGLVTRASER